MAPELKQQSALLQPQDHLEIFIKHFCYFHMLYVENTANYREKMPIIFYPCCGPLVASLFTAQICADQFACKLFRSTQLLRVDCCWAGSAEWL